MARSTVKITLLLSASLSAADTCTFPSPQLLASSSRVACAPHAVVANGQQVVAGQVPSRPFGSQSAAEVQFSDAGLVRYAGPTERSSTAYPPARIGTVQRKNGCNAPTWEEAKRIAEENINISASHAVDILSFFEEFWPTCEAPATEACLEQQTAALTWCENQSRAHKMWLLCPMHYFDLRSATSSSRHTNSVFVFNRSGAMVGRYDKLFPVYQPANGIGTEDRDPSIRGVQVFDTDFGFRFCIIICNDIMFQEVPAQCQALGAELIFWPAAWKGGRHADAMAAVNNVHVVNSPNGCGGGDARIVDHTGAVVQNSDLVYMDDNLKIVQFDPEESIVHENVNGDLMKKMLQQYPLSQTVDEVSEWWVIKARANATQPVPVRHILRKFGIPTINELRRWNREGANMARMHEASMPTQHPVYPAGPADAYLPVAETVKSGIAAADVMLAKII